MQHLSRSQHCAALLELVSGMLPPVILMHAGLVVRRVCESSTVSSTFEADLCPSCRHTTSYKQRSWPPCRT